MRACLFEDAHVLDLEPITWTRPAYEILCGQTSLAEKQWRYFDSDACGALVRPELAELQIIQRPDVAVNDLDWLRSAPTVLINSRWLPPASSELDLSSPFVAIVEDEVAYVNLDEQELKTVTPENLEERITFWKETLPQREAGGRLFRYLWEVVDANGEQLIQDFQTCTIRGQRSWCVDIGTIGPECQAKVHPTAHVDPMVVMDVKNGPVVIDHHAVIEAFTRLEGPCYVGPETQVLGGKIRSGTTLGPGCRIGGEVEASIVQGYSNKYHDGFLGHAYLGEWVNLGAGTQNSDLRNDYGEVAVYVQGQRTNTGLSKVGCFLGDHTKSGLGTLLNTGSNVGAFCNLLPAFLLPKHVPSFTRVWNGTVIENVSIEDLLTTAAKVMNRRGKELTAAYETLYREVQKKTEAQRQKAFREAEQRRLRRSA